MLGEKLSQGGLSVDYGIQRNRFVGLFKRKIVNKLKGYRDNYVLNRLYKKHFINNQDKKNAIVLASFGKSGNTWVRLIFANIIALQEMDGEVIDYHKLDEMLPYETCQEGMYKPWRYKTIPCIVKTHKPYRNIYDRFNKFYVYRNPLDTMISQYYYVTTRIADPATKEKPKKVEDIRYVTEEWKRRGTGAYMRHSLGLNRWCHHFNSWIGHCNASCSYELLKSVPKTTFKTALDRLSLQVGDEVIEEAIKRSDFKRSQTLEDKFGKSPKMAQLSTRFARKGTIGQWKDYFDKSDISYFKAKMSEYNIDISRFEYGSSLGL